MTTTLLFIIGFFIGALITSTVLYILKLRKQVEQQDDIIKHLTLASMRDDLRSKILKKAAENAVKDTEDKESAFKPDKNPQESEDRTCHAGDNDCDRVSAE